MTKKVADYFMEHGQFDKAMEILVRSKKIGEALDLCMTHNITLTEDLVERMTIPKKPNGKCKKKLYSLTDYAVAVCGKTLGNCYTV